MPELQEGRHTGEFVVSEGNGRISRETVTVLSGETLQAGAVLGKVTASGKYKALDPAAVDGSVRDNWTRQALINEANRLYGQRPAASGQRPGELR